MWMLFVQIHLASQNPKTKTPKPHENRNGN